MIETPMTRKALDLATVMHKDQVDKAGMPYILHPIHVAEQMDDEKSTTVALLHDIVEDTDMTFEDLSKEGFPADVIDALTYLTHPVGQDYYEYIKNIAKNPIATKVKIADLTHNSDLSRLDKVTSDDIARVERYSKCLDFLSQEQDKVNTR